MDPADRPDLVPVAFGAKTNLAWGERFTAQGAVRNDGNTATPAAMTLGSLLKTPISSSGATR